MTCKRKRQSLAWLVAFLVLAFFSTVRANGNVLPTGGKSFTYDAENHLTGMTVSGTTVSIIYDAFGNRVSKTVNGVTTKYLVEDDVNPTGYPQVLDELTGSIVTRTYTYGLQRISQDQIIDGVWTPSFYGYDGGGNVRQLTNSAGAVTDTYEYDAFGNDVYHTGTTPNNYLYRGEQWDPGLGLYYQRARYYNPLTGRFLSQDPYSGSISDPGSLHKYAYGHSDPTDRMDPSGLSDAVENLDLTTKVLVQSSNLIKVALELNCMYGIAAAGVDLYAHFSLLGVANVAVNVAACSVTGEGELPIDPVEEPPIEPAPDEPTSCSFCFAAGTPIHTDHGDVPVEQIKVGDEVESRNSVTGKLELEPVTALTPLHKDSLLEIRVEGERSPLRPSTRHPFWVRRGDSPDGAWVESGKMRVGDLLQTVDGNWRRVTAITPLSDQATVYNFTVANDHDYFVGETGFLAHNENCYCRTFFNKYPHLRGKVQVHHGIEQQVLDNYPGLFNEEEIQDLENLRGIPNEIAPEIHQGFLRQLWNNFYKEFPPGTATPEDFLNERQFIDEQLGQYFNPPCGGPE